MSSSGPHTFSALCTALLRRLGTGAGLLLLGASAAPAEDLPPVPELPSLSNYRGLSADELTALLGRPDRRQMSSAERETWVYGRSLFFLEDGEVEAWSDSGDLRSRRNVAGLKAEEQAEQEPGKWVNEWTPASKEQTEDEVLEEIMKSATAGQP